jgi:signal transduction histidine kinase/DNA-binding LacI/PurR family transcriptional regulator
MGLKGDFPVTNKRLTLGFLTFYQNPMMDGIFKAAEKYDVSIICFFYNVETTGQKCDVNALVKLIKEQNLDGLLFLGWIQIVGLDIESFRRYFEPLPLFSLGTGHNDVPGIYMDSTIYLHELLVHLVEAHNCRQTAFISPIIWDERVNTYIEVMKKYRIYNPALVIDAEELKPAGLDLELRAKLAVEVLLDKRKVPFDSITSLYSDEAVAILTQLQARGICVPEDVKVIGNENKENEKYSNPPLTTIYYPFWELGYYGCEKFITMLSNTAQQDIPTHTILPGKLIFRESCGCLSHAIRITEDGYTISEQTPAAEPIDLPAIQDQLIASLPHNKYVQGRLLEHFLASFTNKNSVLFLKALREQLIMQQSNPEESFGIEDFLSCLHNILLSRLYTQKDELIWLENLFHQSRITIQEQILKLLGEKRINVRRMNQALQNFSQEMITPFNFKDLMDTLAHNFSQIDIPSCYLFLDKGKGPANDYTLVFEYVNGKRIIPPTTLVSSSNELPKNLFPQNRRYTLLCLFLGVEDEHLGFVLFEPGRFIETTYQALAIQLSTTIKGILLLEKLENANLELKMIQEELVDKAHQAGMADIATGTLHNVGNILNSINASTQVMQDALKHSPLADFKQANQLLAKNLDSLEEFMTNNPKGKKLFQFYLKLFKPFAVLQEQLQSHLSRLSEKTKLVNEIIIAQQTYAYAKPILEEMDLEEIIEDTLKMQSTALEKYRIEVVRRYESVPKVIVQKTKLFHVLINLFNNARDAMQTIPAKERKLILTLRTHDQDVEILITDTGVGIPPDLLAEIFTSGFTTKKEGHGFGLHSCANYMVEMGGRFWAESPGAGQGATFTLSFPQQKKN